MPRAASIGNLSSTRSRLSYRSMDSTSDWCDRTRNCDGSSLCSFRGVRIRRSYCKFLDRREHVCDEWTFIVIGELTGLLQKQSHRLGIGVRKPACHRAFGSTRPHALERVANKTDEHLALAESAVGVMNGSASVCIVTLHLDRLIAGSGA